MSTGSNATPRTLPARPSLRHLKDQAKDLIKSGAAASLSDAQFTIARLYGFASWPKLQARVRLAEQLHSAHESHDAARFRALLDGQVTVDDFEERRFKEPRAAELVKRVALRSDPSLSGPGREAYGVKIEVQLRNGSVLRAELPAPPGSMQNPADEEILGKKFLALSENVLGRVRAQKAIEVILSVERTSNLKDLLSAVFPSKTG